jgi:fructose-1,6-bisphosphatase/inositol monophosphatase family enzyme
MPEQTSISTAERQEFLEYAEYVANQTRDLVLELWHKGDFGAQLKADRSPVTNIDLKAEKLARKLLSEKYPNHGVIGEEYEALNPESEFQWTVDPIDGTQNLVNRIPTFGTLIGLRYKGKAIVGVIDHPALNQRCSGGEGLGVKIDGKSANLQDLESEEFSDNDILVSNCAGTFGQESNCLELFKHVMTAHPHMRIYYDCYSHTLALAGSVAAVLEPNLKIWDITPTEALIREAGGSIQFFNLPGQTSRLTRCNAVFGKSKAVKIMMQRLNLTPEVKATVAV